MVNNQKNYYVNRLSNPFEHSPKEYPCLVGLESYNLLGDGYNYRYRLVVYDITDSEIREFVDIIRLDDIRRKIRGEE